MKKLMQTLRGKVVEISRGRFTFLDDMPEYEQTLDGEQLTDFADVVGNPNYVILTRGMWERVMLFLTGMFDGKAVMLMGEVLHLDGLRIVKHKNGILAPCDAGGPLPREHCPMILHDRGQFKALVPFREASDSEASDGTDEESKASGGTDGESGASSGTDEESEAAGGTDEESEASGGTDGEKSAAPDVDSEASGGTDGEESGDTPRRYHDWSDDEFYGDDETWLHQTGQEWDGWSLVGKKGVARTRSETRQVSPQDAFTFEDATDFVFSSSAGMETVGLVAMLFLALVSFYVKSKEGGRHMLE
eukprot:g5512.t1